MEEMGKKYKYQELRLEEDVESFLRFNKILDIFFQGFSKLPGVFLILFSQKTGNKCVFTGCHASSLFVALFPASLYAGTRRQLQIGYLLALPLARALYPLHCVTPRPLSLLHSPRGLQRFPGRLCPLVFPAPRTTGNSTWKQEIPKAVPGRSAHTHTLSKMAAPMGSPEDG